MKYLERIRWTELDIKNMKTVATRITKDGLKNLKEITHLKSTPEKRMTSAGVLDEMLVRELKSLKKKP